MDYITIRGVKSTKLRNFFRQFIIYSLDQVYASRPDLDIMIEMSTDLYEKTRYYGLCEPIEWGQRPREFLIECDISRSFKQVLKTLAHEITHIKQLAKSELYDYQTSHLIRWKNRKVDQDAYTRYRNIPWEKEAYRMEKILYDKFCSQYETKEFKDIHNSL